MPFINTHYTRNCIIYVCALVHVDHSTVGTFGFRWCVFFFVCLFVCVVQFLALDMRARTAENMQTKTHTQRHGKNTALHTLFVFGIRNGRNERLEHSGWPETDCWPKKRRSHFVFALRASRQLIWLFADQHLRISEPTPPLTDVASVAHAANVCLAVAPHVCICLPAVRQRQNVVGHCLIHTRAGAYKRRCLQCIVRKERERAQNVNRIAASDATAAEIAQPENNRTRPIPQQIHNMKNVTVQNGEKTTHAS